jgi:hypothetical protein
MQSTSELSKNALHEAAHIVITAKVAETARPIKQVKIMKSYGYVKPSWKATYKYDALGDAAIFAAGVACCQIMGDPIPARPGDDMTWVREFFPDESEHTLIIDKTRQWLEQNWHHVQWTAEALLNSRRHDGTIPVRDVMRIVATLRGKFGLT